MLQLNHH